MKPQTYTIRTLADIYNLPTFEQVKTAAVELAEMIILTRMKNDLFAEIAKANGMEVPNGIAMKFPESIEWIDDGKGEVSLELQEHDGTKVAELKWKTPNRTNQARTPEQARRAGLASAAARKLRTDK